MTDSTAASLTSQNIHVADSRSGHASLHNAGYAVAKICDRISDTKTAAKKENGIMQAATQILQAVG